LCRRRLHLLPSLPLIMEFKQPMSIPAGVHDKRNFVVATSKNKKRDFASHTTTSRHLCTLHLHSSDTTLALENIFLSTTSSHTYHTSPIHRQQTMYHYFVFFTSKTTIIRSIF
jgi:hypothetical protein